MNLRSRKYLPLSLLIVLALTAVPLSALKPHNESLNAETTLGSGYIPTSDLFKSSDFDSAVSAQL